MYEILRIFLVKLVIFQYRTIDIKLRFRYLIMISFLWRVDFWYSYSVFLDWQELNLRFKISAEYKFAYRNLLPGGQQYKIAIKKKREPDPTLMSFISRLAY